MTKQLKDFLGGGFFILMIFVGSIFLIVGSFYSMSSIYKIYNVWSESKEGEAELAKADWNTQIAVKEADAKRQSAYLLAEAEVIRAEGVAKANKIIGESLNNNEAYLRYLWVNNLSETSNQVIYVPTETNMPILEAGKRK